MFKLLLMWTSCLLLWCRVSSPEYPQEIKAESGENVTLQCRSHRDGNITLLRWRRADLKSDKYVFFIRDDQQNGNFQHPSFIGRVQLKNPEMKDGNVSVILKNVNINDTGSYECHVAVDGKAPELMNIFNLTVKEPGDKEGGDKEGGDKEGGDKEGGDKQGGDKQGGDKQGRDEDGGDKQRGDEDGGDKQGRDEEGDMRGRVGLIVGLLVTAGLIVVAFVGLLIFKNSKRKKYSSLTEKALDQQIDP